MRIILVDGGVDSLMRGDESRAGTIFEDFLSLLAVSQLNNIKVRITACLGLGVEHELDNAYVFENIAHLAKQDALLGVCALTKQMPAYQRFEEAVLYVFDQQAQIIQASSAHPSYQLHADIMAITISPNEHTEANYISHHSCRNIGSSICKPLRKITIYCRVCTSPMKWKMLGKP